MKLMKSKILTFFLLTIFPIFASAAIVEFDYSVDYKGADDSQVESVKGKIRTYTGELFSITSDDIKFEGIVEIPQDHPVNIIKLSGRIFKKNADNDDYTLISSPIIMTKVKTEAVLESKSDEFELKIKFNATSITE